MIQNYSNSTQYQCFISILNQWGSGGVQTTSNGATCICRVPNLFPSAWLHFLYRGLDAEGIHTIQSCFDIKLPDDFVEFLKRSNGVNIFSDSLSIWGLRRSYDRSGELSFQPYDIIEMNKEIHMKWLLVIGSYSWDGSLVVYDSKLSDKKVFRVSSDKYEILNEWDSFWDFLSQETSRLSAFYDVNGYSIDDAIPTTP